MPYGYGGNVAPRLNIKLGDDETLTLQGFLIQNNFRNRGETTLREVTPNTIFPQRRRCLPEPRSVQRLAYQRVQYNNRFR